MTPITSSTVAFIKNKIEQTMLDSGTIEGYVEVVDSLHSITKTWPTGTETKCGFSLGGGSKGYQPQYVTESESASVRLPLDTNISKLDHFTLTKRLGVSVDPITFGVESIQTGLFELVVKLKNLEA